MDYRERLLTLARRHNVSVVEDQLHHSTSGSNSGLRRIEVAPVRDEVTFMIALHELGHIVTKPMGETALRGWMRNNRLTVLGVIAYAQKTGESVPAHAILPKDLVQDEEARATAWSLEHHIPSAETARVMLDAHRSYDDAPVRTPEFHQVHERLRALAHG